mmetsp:Transcript_147811/g.474480  ORF Transcript_147811/g.474480 Transcript_147811/m.474480 type:complete len:547 (-) Transcript_147811:1620-3260(-)
MPLRVDAPVEGALGTGVLAGLAGGDDCAGRDRGRAIAVGIQSELFNRPFQAIFRGVPLAVLLRPRRVAVGDRPFRVDGDVRRVREDCSCWRRLPIQGRLGVDHDVCERPEDSAHGHHDVVRAQAHRVPDLRLACADRVLREVHRVVENLSGVLWCLPMDHAADLQGVKISIAEVQSSYCPVRVRDCQSSRRCRRLCQTGVAVDHKVCVSTYNCIREECDGVRTHCNGGSQLASAHATGNASGQVQGILSHVRDVRGGVPCHGAGQVAHVQVEVRERDAADGDRRVRQGEGRGRRLEPELRARGDDQMAVRALRCIYWDVHFVGTHFNAQDIAPKQRPRGCSDGVRRQVHGVVGHLGRRIGRRPRHDASELGGIKVEVAEGDARHGLVGVGDGKGCRRRLLAQFGRGVNEDFLVVSESACEGRVRGHGHEVRARAPEAAEVEGATEPCAVAAGTGVREEGVVERDLAHVVRRTPSNLAPQLTFVEVVVREVYARNRGVGVRQYYVGGCRLPGVGRIRVDHDVCEGTRLEVSRQCECVRVQRHCCTVL